MQSLLSLMQFSLRQKSKAWVQVQVLSQRQRICGEKQTQSNVLKATVPLPEATHILPVNGVYLFQTLTDPES